MSNVNPKCSTSSSQDVKIHSDFPMIGKMNRHEELRIAEIRMIRHFESQQERINTRQYCGMAALPLLAPSPGC
jgi:hypothetical protein